MESTDMTAGIEIYNDNNILQITSNFRNMGLIEKGVVPSTKTMTWSKDEIMAFRCDNGNTFTLEIAPVITNGVTTCGVYGSSTVYFYRFGYAGNLTGHYFEVYDQNGAIVFSDLPYLRVIGSNGGFAANPPPYVGYIDSFNIPNGKTAAIVVGKGCSVFDYGSDVVRNILGQEFLFAPNKVTSSYYYEYKSQYTGGQYLASTSYNYLVLDVTNY